MKQQSPEQAEQAREFAVAAARLAADVRCLNVVVMDVRGISPITDFFVLATGTSERQMRGVAEQIEQDVAPPRNYSVFTRAGYNGSNWLLTDYVDVVVHIFTNESRAFYDLDGLWGDAPRVEWQPQPAGANPGKT